MCNFQKCFVFDAKILLWNLHEKHFSAICKKLLKRGAIFWLRWPLQNCILCDYFCKDLIKDLPGQILEMALFGQVSLAFSLLRIVSETEFWTENLLKSNEAQIFKRGLASHFPVRTRAWPLVRANLPLCFYAQKSLVFFWAFMLSYLQCDKRVKPPWQVKKKTKYDISVLCHSAPFLKYGVKYLQVPAYFFSIMSVAKNPLKLEFFIVFSEEILGGKGWK